MRLEIARILPRPLLLATAVIFEPSLLRTQNNLHGEDETTMAFLAVGVCFHLFVPTKRRAVQRNVALKLP